MWIGEWCSHGGCGKKATHVMSYCLREDDDEWFGREGQVVTRSYCMKHLVRLIYLSGGDEEDPPPINAVKIVSIDIKDWFATVV
jgi:hypothetical protein